MMLNDLRGRTLGDYVLVERIGKGGMSEVWKAETPAGKFVAMKLLRIEPEQAENKVFIARFEREARIIADLSHPHILPMVDYGEDGNYVYLAMRYLSGGTLAEVIKRGRMSPQTVSRYLKQLASALDHAHKLQVIHRDLKPTNVLLDEEGNAYLTDFGIARFANMIGDLTETGNVMGTPAYMAPEQWRAQMLDARTDIYGLSVMAYLMLTGHTPFEADEPHSMMYQHLDQPPPPLGRYAPELPVGIQKVLFKALAKRAEDRYPSASAFAVDFENAIYGKAVQADTEYHLPMPQAQMQPAIPMPPPALPRTPLYPIPPQLMPQRPTVPRWMWPAVIGMVTVLILIAMGGALLLWNAVMADSDATPTGRPTATPQVTPDNRPVDVPRVVIESPQDASRQVTAELGEIITIRVTAYDHEGVTRVELRYEGAVVKEVTTSAQTQFTAEFTYTPLTPGLHRLEVVAFRGDLKGDSNYLTLEVDSNE